ncbi:MAG: hypothetical protein U0271_17335 [Polyangiaceae bacterium]
MIKGVMVGGRSLALLALLSGASCAVGNNPPGSGGSGATTSDGGGGSAEGAASQGGQGGAPLVGGAGGGFIEPAGGAGGVSVCTAVAEPATLEVLPVDIIWVVDNSNSMQPAIAQVKQGLNTFASLIAASALDYKVILLSKRGTTDLQLCIPPPLAGDAACGNGPRFFHSDVEIFSTQPLEQFLGTLGQTAGYQPSDAKGGDPWLSELRPEATKTIVVVTDDNARLSATDFQTFPGGQNPFNSLTLPPGIMDPSWNGLFNGFLFSGIYGWGSDVDPSVKCVFPDTTMPSASGATYTTLVNQTGGVRAKICDGAATWGPFLNAVAQAVTTTSKVSCSIEIPPPPEGETLDFEKVNVQLTSGDMGTLIPYVASESACAGLEGWYYDDVNAPTHVELCPASCDHAQELAGPNKPGGVDVLFGCETIAH